MLMRVRISPTLYFDQLLPSSDSHWMTPALQVLQKRVDSVKPALNVRMPRGLKPHLDTVVPTTTNEP